MSGKKNISIDKKEHSYLNKLITSELEKYEEVLEDTKNPQIKEEREILISLKKVL